MTTTQEHDRCDPLVRTYPTPRRPGRASLAVVVGIVALAVGAVAGYGLSRGSGAKSAASETPSGDEQMYTCGMHPNVLQMGPGDCPICQMKLTPLKSSGDDVGKSIERRVLYWRAPMDPNYVSDKPGKSPMGMDLVPVYADADASGSSHAIRIDPVTIQNMGIRTEAVRRGPLIKTIRTVGRVDYDERLVTFIDTKFNGWIETLYASQTGQHVEKAERLFSVYSPELYAAQEEYLAAIRNLPLLEKSNFKPAREEAVKLVEAAVTKLKYLDVSDSQIDSLRESGKIEKSLTIHSPASGIVTEKMALEGMYVKPGMRLYTIADLSRVWVYVDVYEYQLPWVRTGQTAVMHLPYVPGKEFVGKVVYIYPYLEQRTRVVKVRLEFENTDLELKPGMFANIKLESNQQRDAVLVPREAYIDSGTRKVAFVSIGSGKFMPRDIQVGVEAEDGMVEVLFGLDEGEVVVTSGQFMLDAESKLKEAVAKMMKSKRATTTKRMKPAAAAMTHDGEHDHGMPSSGYACPMEKHPDEASPENQGAYFSEDPGRCPLCNMKLKPIDDLEWVRAKRATQGGDVGYTCPDHQHVFSDQSGECPRCGKELTSFKVMYTCPDPQHAAIVTSKAGNCPRCSRGLAAMRSVWLTDDMAPANLPSSRTVAETAAYRCAVHPLVHSSASGACTICGADLTQAGDMPTSIDRSIPASAKYTCSMQACWHFSAEPGVCPECGMQLKTLDQVAWTKDFPRQASGDAGHFVCPMHTKTVRASRPGPCPKCGMKLVDESTLETPSEASEHVAAQMGFVMEHYLEVQRLLASDRTADLTLHALGLAAASDELAEHLRRVGDGTPIEVTKAAHDLHAAALKMTGILDEDRVTFVAMGDAVRTLVAHARPDRTRWPKLYLYHCPMSKGDWFQTAKDKANPYYGFKMLKCGELKSVE